MEAWSERRDNDYPALPPYTRPIPIVRSHTGIAVEYYDNSLQRRDLTAAQDYWEHVFDTANSERFTAYLLEPNHRFIWAFGEDVFLRDDRLTLDRQRQPAGAIGSYLRSSEDGDWYREVVVTGMGAESQQTAHHLVAFLGMVTSDAIKRRSILWEFANRTSIRSPSERTLLYHGWFSQYYDD